MNFVLNHIVYIHNQTKNIVSILKNPSKTQPLPILTPDHDSDIVQH